MIVCPKCSKENQDHYKFCLGCGSDLPRNENAATVSTATPPAGVAAAAAPVPKPVDNAATEPPSSPAPEPAPEPAPAPAPAPAPEPAPAPAPAPEPAPEPAPAPAPAPESAPEQAATSASGQSVKCANCGSDVPEGFAFCGGCGTPVGATSPPQSSDPAQQGAPQGASIVLIQPDGSEGGLVEIPESEVLVGRDAGGFFESDAYLSPKHAVFRAGQGQIFVRDENSLNGVFKKIAPNEPIEIQSGSVFRMGQELILFEAIDKGSDAPDGTRRMGSPIDGLWGRLAMIVAKGRLGNAFPLAGEGVVCGRERGNILFPEDGYISGVHLRIHTENNRFYLTDLGSSNGTYIKLDEETALNNGEFILMGAQLFRIQA